MRKITAKDIDGSKIKEENIYISSEKSAEITIKNPIQTGTLKFQFNQDEPEELAKVYGCGKITIELQQSKDKNGIQQLNTSIEFISRSGNTFRLFIDNYE